MDRLLAWFHANDEALLVGAIAAASLIAIMLILRAAGEKITAADPECRSWKSVIGRVLAKTSMAFMVVAAKVTTTSIEPTPPTAGLKALNVVPSVEYRAV